MGRKKCQGNPPPLTSCPTDDGGRCAYVWEAHLKGCQLHTRLNIIKNFCPDGITGPARVTRGGLPKPQMPLRSRPQQHQASFSREEWESLAEEPMPTQPGDFLSLHCRTQSAPCFPGGADGFHRTKSTSDCGTAVGAGAWHASTW